MKVQFHFWSVLEKRGCICPNDLITIIRFSLLLTLFEGMGCFDGTDCNVTENKLIFLTLLYTVLLGHNLVVGFKEIKVVSNQR